MRPTPASYNCSQYCYAVSQDGCKFYSCEHWRGSVWQSYMAVYLPVRKTNTFCIIYQLGVNAGQTNVRILHDWQQSPQHNRYHSRSEHKTTSSPELKKSRHWAMPTKI